MVLPKLKKSRGGRRTAISRVLKSLENSIREEKMEDVEELLAQLGLKEVTLYELDKSVEALTPEAELEDEIAKSEDYNEQITTWKVRGNRFLEATRKQLAMNSDNSRQPMLVNATNTTKCTIKLPKLQIQKYNGDLTEWNRFWDQFSTAIHDNMAVSTIDKFNYLKTLLEDKAATTIKGLKMTEANYAVAVHLLKDRFGKKEVMVNEHINKLLKLKSVQQSMSGDELRRLMEDVETQIRALEALGVDVQSFGTWLCPIIMKTLPHDTIVEWSRATEGKKDDDLNELLKFLKKEVESKERAWRAREQENEKWTEYRRGEEGRKKASLPSAAALPAHTSQFSKPLGACFFCNSPDHRAASCEVMTSIDDRLEALKKMGRCFRCLGMKHTAKFCNRTVICQSCGKPHNSALCRNRIRQEKRKEAEPVIVTSNLEHFV